MRSPRIPGSNRKVAGSYWMAGWTNILFSKLCIKFLWKLLDQAEPQLTRENVHLLCGILFIQTNKKVMKYIQQGKMDNKNT